MSDLTKTINAVLSAHDAASLRLKDVCQSLDPKRSDGRLNDVGRTIVLKMIDAGMSNKDIAMALEISSSAVTQYRRLQARAARSSTQKQEPNRSIATAD